VSESAPRHSNFLGTWILIPESCVYEQGDPPRAGTQTIEERDGKLVFVIGWTAADGRSDEVRLEGVPDGQPRPFAGGELADAIAVSPVSPRDLRVSAFRGGVELMVAQRQLDDTGTAMRVTQLVRFPDGTYASNRAVYRKRLPSS
jgi:hypothetical protein